MNALLLYGGALTALYAFGRWVGHPPALRWLMPGVLVALVVMVAALITTVWAVTGGA